MKTGRRNINHLRYADDTILRTECSNDVKWFLMKVKEENAKAGLHLNIKKTKIKTTEETHNLNADNADTETKIVLTWVPSSIHMEAATEKSGEG